MSINFKGTHIDISEAMRTHAEKQFASVERFFKGDEKIVFDVELAKMTHHHKKGNVFYAEANLEVNGTVFRASAEEETLEAAVDEVKNELMRELRKNKTRRVFRARREEGEAKRTIRGE